MRLSQTSLLFCRKYEFSNKKKLNVWKHSAVPKRKKRLVVLKLLDTVLTEREGKVLRLRYGLRDGRTRTLEEIGQGLSVTRERVRQIESRALQKLRSPQASKKVADYLKSN